MSGQCEETNSPAAPSSDHSSPMHHREEEEFDERNFPDHADRNPEPPPDLEEEKLLDADNIGNTVFSKRWTLNALMKLLQLVRGPTGDTAAGDTASEDTAARVTASGDGDSAVDLDDDLQDELCKLWDMSMNSDVVDFLWGFNTMDILVEVVAKSKAPRAIEICVGILGNMACNETVATRMTENHKFVELAILLFENPDPQTLIETIRLVSVCLSNEKCRESWLAIISRDEKVFQQLVFILHSSTNGTLLEQAGELLDTILDLSSDTEAPLSQYYSTQLIDALIESTNQASKSGSLTGRESFMHILQLMTTTETGVKLLVERGGEVVQLVMSFLQLVCEDSVVTLDGHENSLASALSVISVLLPTWPHSYKLVHHDYQLMRCVLKIADSLFPKLHPEVATNILQHPSSSSGPGHSPTHATPSMTFFTSPGYDTPGGAGAGGGWRTPFTRGSVAQGGVVTAATTRMLDMLAEVVGSCCVEVVVLLHKHGQQEEATSNHTAPSDNHTPTENSHNTASPSTLIDHSPTTMDSLTNVPSWCRSGQTTTPEKTSNPPPPPLTLEYLNSMCLRSRLQYLVHILKNSPQQPGEMEVLQLFQDSILQYKLERLRQVVRST